MKKVLAAAIFALLVSGPVAAYATTTKESRSNDHVLVGTDGDFQEWFKRDSGSKSVFQQHNNYIYTTSQVVDAPPTGKCLVVTGDSEKTIAVWCNDGPSGK